MKQKYIHLNDYSPYLNTIIMIYDMGEREGERGERGKRGRERERARYLKMTGDPCLSFTNATILQHLCKDSISKRHTDKNRTTGLSTSEVTELCRTARLFGDFCSIFKRTEPLLSVLCVSFTEYNSEI